MSLLRRTFIRGAVASVIAAPARAPAQSPLPGTRRRIDVHHHILPSDYVRIIGGRAIGAPSLRSEAPMWDVSRSLAAMDAAGVTGAVISISAPGVLMDDPGATRRLARSCSEFATQLVTDYPGRYGMFASLPLPDVGASLEELDYALDTLKADGVVLMSNFADRYLGDPAFAPVFDRLNARKAVVFVHPTTCRCGLGVLPNNPPAMIEYPHDTTRTITDLLFSGTFARCPDIKFIFSHAGGTLPFLASRIAGSVGLRPAIAAHYPDGVLAVFRRLNYDTTSSVNPNAFSALMQLVTPKNVLLGSDFPFTPAAALKTAVEGLSQLGLDTDAVLAIEARNASTLFPRFR